MMDRAEIQRTASISIWSRTEGKGTKAPMQYRNGAQRRLFVKLCSDRSAFEARPMKQMTLDMNKVKLALMQRGPHEIVVDTPHIIVVKSGKAETTVSRDGRMLIKRVLNEEEATQVANEILDAILEKG